MDEVVEGTRPMRSIDVIKADLASAKRRKAPTVSSLEEELETAKRAADVTYTEAEQWLRRLLIAKGETV